LLSGPGAIATVMVLVGQAKTNEGRISVYVAIVLVALMTFLILRSASYVARALGRTGINIITRLMGLILAAMAIQFVIEGGLDAFPVLGSRIAPANLR
jgi:multiple antibiotic resistance protein